MLRLRKFSSYILLAAEQRLTRFSVSLLIFFSKLEAVEARTNGQQATLNQQAPVLDLLHESVKELMELMKSGNWNCEIASG